MIPIALASDTLSIATMEVVDNLILVAIPGAMHAGLGDLLFWGSLAFALVIAGAVAVPVNRWLIARGKGHAVVHETGIHGGPSPRLVGFVAAVAFVFGTAVLVAEAFDGGEERTTAGGTSPRADTAGRATLDPVRGLFPTSDGMTLQLATSHLQPGRPRGAALPDHRSERHACARLRGRAREADAPDSRPQRPDRVPAPPPEARP